MNHLAAVANRLEHAWPAGASCGCDWGPDSPAQNAPANGLASGTIWATLASFPVVEEIKDSRTLFLRSDPAELIEEASQELPSQCEDRAMWKHLEVHANPGVQPFSGQRRWEGTL